MDQQKGQFFLEIPALLRSLTAGLGDADYHIAQGVLFPPSSLELLPLQQREGKDVSGFVFLAIALVEFADFSVAGQNDGKFGFLFKGRTLDGFERERG